MQKSDLLYPRVQQVLPLLQTSFNHLVSDFGGAKCNLSRSAGDTALAGVAAIQQGLETLEKPTGTSQIPSQVQCWCPQYKTRTHRSNSSEGPRRWFRDWSKRLSELGWSRGSSQWCSGMAKSHQAPGEIWSCVSAQEKGVKPRIILPSEVVESPSLEIFKAQPLLQQGLGWITSRGASNISPSGTLAHQRKWTPWVTSFSQEWLEKYFVWNVPLVFLTSDGFALGICNETAACDLLSLLFPLVVCVALPFSPFKVNLAYLRSCLFCNTFFISVAEQIIYS